MDLVKKWREYKAKLDHETRVRDHHNIESLEAGKRIDQFLSEMTEIQGQLVSIEGTLDLGIAKLQIVLSEQPEREDQSLSDIMLRSALQDFMRHRSLVAAG